MTAATATDNNRLALKLGGFESLCEALDYAADGVTGANFFSPRGQLIASCEYREIRDQARAQAAALAGLGLSPGERVALMAETSPEFLIAFYACQYAGLIPVPLPLNIHMGAKKAYVTRLRGMIEVSEAVLVLGFQENLSSLSEACEGRDLQVLSFEDLAELPRKGDLAPYRSGSAPCYIQFSSGSTTAPRGVMISQRALMANGTGILREGMRIVTGDRGCSWLPLYHDMGLVGFCLAPMMGQVTIDYLSTAGFARRPLVWLRLISEYASSISFSPTFGYELCCRRGLPADSRDLDLSSWRIAGIGGEMVRAEVLRRFSETFGPVGFSESAYLPSYGLAESTLAVTFPEQGQGAESDWVDMDHLAATGRIREPEADGQAQSRSFVRCGKVLSDHALEIRDDRNNRLDEGQVGRVLVRGPSVMAGYQNDPERTAGVLDSEGWLDTGDLGYLTDGQLVITGRAKDLIILNGRNIWPQDIEWLVESLDGLRAGDVACFAIDKGDVGDGVMIVVQSRNSDPDALQALEQLISATVQKSMGVTCDILSVPPKSLTFTSSGKLSRAAVKADYESGRLQSWDVLSAKQSENRAKGDDPQLEPQVPAQ